MLLIRFIVAGFLALAPGLAAACGAIAEAPYPRLQRASENPGTEITFLGHASFLIRSPGGITAVTDYNGTHIPDFPPDIATMNMAHTTHWTSRPDPRIAHVLRGWREDGKQPVIDLQLGDMRVRNIPTNIRNWGGEGTRTYGNSIFIFESGGLCIAHLGHLHHLLTEDDIANLGQIDILMAPIDGTWTLSHEDMATIIDQMHPRLILAMHHFGEHMLHRFARLVADRYPLRVMPGASAMFRRESLPATPELVWLPGPYY